MGATTDITWAEATWNAVYGCSPAPGNKGCDNCYAKRWVHRFAGHQNKLGETSRAVENWDGNVRFMPERLIIPLKWRTPKTIFANSLFDLFHPNIPDEWIDKIFAAICAAHWHRYLILTKRTDRMRVYLTTPGRYHRISQYWSDLVQLAFIRNEYPKLKPGMKPIDPKKPVFPHVAFLASISTQADADRLIPDLLETPVAYRGVSYEPSLGKIDLQRPAPHSCETEDCVRHGNCPPWMIQLLDLVIMGGESGPKARPMHPDWARSMRDQCASAGVPFHFKQWGEFAPCPINPCEVDMVTDAVFKHGPGHDGFVWRVGKKNSGRLLDGVEHNGTIDWGISR